MISGLCCTDSQWPLQLWGQLTKQELITLNLCRTSRKHPNKSTYYSYHSQQYNWNKHPMTTQCTRTVVFQALENRTSWGPRGLDVWYCGPTFDHYQNMIFCSRNKSLRHLSLIWFVPTAVSHFYIDRSEHSKTVTEEWLEGAQRLRSKQRKKQFEKYKRQFASLSMMDSYKNRGWCSDNRGYGE